MSGTFAAFPGVHHETRTGRSKKSSPNDLLLGWIKEHKDSMTLSLARLKNGNAITMALPVNIASALGVNQQICVTKGGYLHCRDPEGKIIGSFA